VDNYQNVRTAVIRWAQGHYRAIQDSGTELSDAGVDLARSVGVLESTHIRVVLVDQVPIMEDPVISCLAKSVGMLNGTIMGMTFGHSIYIARGFESTRLYSHEFRHVYQYETFGSLEAFMEEYLHQVLTFGYSKAPLELDAKEFEIE
tara:strand:+ start:1112 stop:1552 length:441 start_codon:yes stop_codon:yes gene_type:complete